SACGITRMWRKTCSLAWVPGVSVWPHWLLDWRRMCRWRRRPATAISRAGVIARGAGALQSGGAPAFLCLAAERWRMRGYKVGFTNGCFDLLHPGHVHLLEQCRALCDRLIVGINADASVKRLKGPTRPAQNEAARAAVLASLASVDLVCLFEDDTPLEI